MSKEELMYYAWMRGFSYEELLHVAGMMTNVVVPTEEEYTEFSRQAFQELLDYSNRKHYDTREEQEIARTELGWGFVKEREVER